MAIILIVSIITVILYFLVFVSQPTFTMLKIVASVILTMVGFTVTLFIFIHRNPSEIYRFPQTIQNIKKPKPENNSGGNRLTKSPSRVDPDNQEQKDAFPAFKEIYLFIVSIAITQGLITFNDILNKSGAGLSSQFGLQSQYIIQKYWLVFQDDPFLTLRLACYFIIAINLVHGGYMFLSEKISRKRSSGISDGERKKETQRVNGIVFFVLSVIQAALLYFVGANLDNFDIFVFWLTFLMFISIFWGAFGRLLKSTDYIKLPSEWFLLYIYMIGFMFILFSINNSSLLPKLDVLYIHILLLITLFIKVILDYFIGTKALYFPSE